MDGAARPPRGIALQVLAALTIVLLPLGVLAIALGVANFQDARKLQATNTAARLESVSRAIGGEFAQDYATLQTALLATGVARDPALCDDMLARIAGFYTRIDAIKRLDRLGRPVCGRGLELGPDERAQLFGAIRGPSSGRFVQALAVVRGELLLAVRDNGVASVGDVVVARAARGAVGRMIDGRQLLAGERIALFDPAGRPIEVERGGLSLRTFATQPPGVQAAEFDGGRWLVGTALPLGQAGPRLVLARPLLSLTGGQLLAIALPTLMWLATLLIAWTTARRLVVRPLVRLRGAIDRYGAGDQATRFTERPQSEEMAAVADAFDRMASRIGEHDEQMRESLAEQKRLTREVHHRVKNNLQIVASLLSIQSRDTKNPEVAHAYGAVQKRVNALSLVHRWMYEGGAGGAAGVDLRALVNDLCAAIEAGDAPPMGIGTLTARSHCEPLRVGQDTAVPLAFLVTELSGVAQRRAGNAPVEVTVSAVADDGTARLTIASPALRGEDPLRPGGGDPAARIVQGMARQMRSPLVHDGTAGSYTIAFPRAG